jgi:hypothetical protein
LQYAPFFLDFELVGPRTATDTPSVLLAGLQITIAISVSLS